MCLACSTAISSAYILLSLTEAAWAASKTKNTSYNAFYHNLVRRKGKKKTLVALAHRMLIDIYFVLKTGEPYQDMGADAIHERTSRRKERSMIRSLEKAGYSVTKAATA
jgi:wobble nucleotide-excising tRNase